MERLTSEGGSEDNIMPPRRRSRPRKAPRRKTPLRPAGRGTGGGGNQPRISAAGAPRFSRPTTPNIAGQQAAAALSQQDSPRPLVTTPGAPPGAVDGSGNVSHQPGTPQSNIIQQIGEFLPKLLRFNR
jgi:hypothetical protein